MRRQFGVIATVLALTLGTVNPANALFFSQPKRENYTVNECLAALDKQAKKSPSRARSIIGAGLGVLGAIAGGSLAVSSFTCGSMFSGLAGLGIAGGAGMMAYKSFKGIAHYKANVEAHDIAKSILDSRATSAQTKLLGEVSLTRDFTGSYLEVINKIQNHSEDEEVITKEEYQKFCVKIDGKSFREALAKGINPHGFIPKDAAEELKRKHPALYNKMVLANPELGEVVPVKEKKEEQAKLQKQPELPAVEEQAPVQAEKKKGLWGKIKGFFHFGKSSAKQPDQAPLTQTQPSFMTTSRDGSAQEVAPVSATTASSSSSQFAFPRFSQFFGSANDKYEDVKQAEKAEIDQKHLKELQEQCKGEEDYLNKVNVDNLSDENVKELRDSLIIRRIQLENAKLLDLRVCTLKKTLEELTKKVQVKYDALLTKNGSQESDQILVKKVKERVARKEEIKSEVGGILNTFHSLKNLKSKFDQNDISKIKFELVGKLNNIIRGFDYVLDENRKLVSDEDKKKIGEVKSIVENARREILAPALPPESPVAKIEKVETRKEDKKDDGTYGDYMRNRLDNKESEI